MYRLRGDTTAIIYDLQGSLIIGFPVTTALSG